MYLWEYDVSWSYTSALVFCFDTHQAISFCICRGAAAATLLQNSIFNNQDLEGCGSSCSTGNSSFSVEFEFSLPNNSTWLVIAASRYTHYACTEHPTKILVSRAQTFMRGGWERENVWSLSPGFRGPLQNIGLANHIAE